MLLALDSDIHPVCDGHDGVLVGVYAAMRYFVLARTAKSLVVIFGVLFSELYLYVYV